MCVKLFHPFSSLSLVASSELVCHSRQTNFVAFCSNWTKLSLNYWSNTISFFLRKANYFHLRWFLQFLCHRRRVWSSVDSALLYQSMGNSIVWKVTESRIMLVFPLFKFQICLYITSSTKESGIFLSLHLIIPLLQHCSFWQLYDKLSRAVCLHSLFSLSLSRSRCSRETLFYFQMLWWITS